MTLNEARAGDKLIVEDVSELGGAATKLLYDKDVYPGSLVAFDGAADGTVRYHKDPLVQRSIDAALASLVKVRRLVRMYFVAMIEDIESAEEAKKKGCQGEATVYGIRVIGYFETLKVAMEVVERNVFDIHEGVYKYAVIEGLEPGVCPTPPDDPIFYRWEGDAWKGSYKRIEKPSQLEKVSGFTIG